MRDCIYLINYAEMEAYRLPVPARHIMAVFAKSFHPLKVARFRRDVMELGANRFSEHVGHSGFA